MKLMSNHRTNSPGDPFLANFFPYRLAVLADLVSRAVSEVYAGRFSLTRAQWRILAALAADPSVGSLSPGNSGPGACGPGRSGMSARDLTDQTMLDKVQVSRAVAGLMKAGLIAGQVNPRDKRSKVLTITADGQALFEEIVPLVRAREAQLLSVLDDRQRSALHAAIDALAGQARLLQTDKSAPTET